MRCKRLLARWLWALFLLSAMAWAGEMPVLQKEGVAVHRPSIAILAPRYSVVIDAPRAIRSVLKEHLDIVRFAQRTDMTTGQFDFLVLATTSQIADILKAKGYFTPKIQVHLQYFSPSPITQLPYWGIPSSTEQKVVSIAVEPGQPIHVKAVKLSFKGAMLTESNEQTSLHLLEHNKRKRQQQDRQAAVREVWSLNKGAIFTQQAWDDAKALALKTLQAERYLGAKIVSSQAWIDPKKHRAYLDVKFDSGPPFILGEVKITDLQRYPEKIIEHVNPLHVGEPYSVDRLLEFQRRIQNTPYFASVVVDAGIEEAQRALDHDEKAVRVAPVKVKVNEYPYHSLRFGVGYNSDLGPHLQGQYSYNNMFGHAGVLDTQGQWDPKQQSAGLTLSSPPDEHAYVYSALANYKRSDIENAEIRSLMTGVQRVRLQSHYEYTYSLILYGDRLQQDNGASMWSRALVPGWSWLRRDVDDLLFPRKGSSLLFSSHGALKGMLTDQSFGRAYFNGRYYVPFGKKGIGVFRMEWGSVLSAGHSAGIPASLLFRAGGSNSIRGYSAQSIGNNVAGAVLPVKYVATGSAEYQYWLNRDWGAALFYDVGTAADTWVERVLYQGIGVGARWRSPVGPIHFDVAYGLRNHRVHPYITLGIAF